MTALVITERAQLSFTDTVRAIHDCPGKTSACFTLYFIALSYEADLTWPTCLICNRCLVEPEFWRFPLSPMSQLLCAPCLVAGADPPITYMVFASDEYRRKTWLIEVAAGRQSGPFPDDAIPQRVYSGAKGNLFEKVKSVYSVEDIAGRFTDLHQVRPGTFKARCPLHQESTPSFYVWTDKDTWRCFGACATGGDVIKLTQELMDRGLLA